MPTPSVPEIAAVPALAGVDVATLARIAATATTIAPGQPVDTTSPLCILSGQIELTLNGAPLGGLDAGDVLIADRLHPDAAATAVTAVRVARLPAALADIADAEEEP